MDSINYVEGKKNKKHIEYWHIKLGDVRVGHVSTSFYDSLTTLDIHINKKHRNMGIGSTALKHVVEASKWNEITAIVRKSNKASCRIFEKNGFVTEAYGTQLKMVYRRTQTNECNGIGDK